MAVVGRAYAGAPVRRKAKATWTPPAVKQRHLISKRFETAALHSASVWALLPGPG